MSSSKFSNAFEAICCNIFQVSKKRFFPKVKNPLSSFKAGYRNEATLEPSWFIWCVHCKLFCSQFVFCRNLHQFGCLWRILTVFRFLGIRCKVWLVIDWSPYIAVWCVHVCTHVSIIPKIAFGSWSIKWQLILKWQLRKCQYSVCK